MRPHVEIFAEKMEERLREKDGAYGSLGWLEKECTVQFLKARMHEKMLELYSSFEDCDPDKMRKICVDVANFAMMIDSRIGLRSIV